MHVYLHLQFDYKIYSLIINIYSLISCSFLSEVGSVLSVLAGGGGGGRVLIFHFSRVSLHSSGVRLHGFGVRLQPTE
jgi:hypothetical protein